MSDTTRRRFLHALAAAPLVTAIAACSREDREPEASPDVDRAGTLGEPDQTLGELVERPEDAIDVFDMRVTAERTLPPAHYGYLATGVDGDATLRANRSAFDRLQIPNRRLVGVEHIDMSATILGTPMKTPIIIAPTGSQRAFHPDGELATARAARAKEHLMMLSTVTTTSVEEVTEARGEPVWYQLYPTSRWDITETILRRAERAGCRVVALTVDLPVDSNRLSLTRFTRRDRRDCTACHASEDTYQSQNTTFARKPMFDGTDMKDEYWNTPMHTWDFVDKLRAATSMQVVIKGIVTGEDASLAVRHGAAAVIVSNHGGRAEESGRATIESLPEVVRAVQGRVPVIFDSGIRRGTDIFKAIALGADAVAIGRPYLWGLASFGQAGVERVLEILTSELRTVMALAGTRTLADIRARGVLAAR
ncbi:MAG TPA: alpha-hydroxy acid oxidase [Vicinamibacterales bacterium]|nr:alpha-hydroxy acid oxidase [Vicinamibacterales bacterium]